MPDMSTTFGPVVPILRMYDLTRTLDFYVGYLGCTVDWQVKVWPNFTRSFTPPITDTCFLVWSDIRAAWK